MSAETRKIVAIQPLITPGDPAAGLKRCVDLVGQAIAETSPDMVFLPEASVTPNLCRRDMRRCHQAVDGEAFQAFRALAREHGCVVGGGAVTIRGGDARNTYFVCEPNGTVHLHDKDQPSMWENNYYSPGTDQGLMATEDGPIGCALGMEWMRTRTAARLSGKVRLVAGGQCFPSYPKWALTRPYFWKREHGQMLDLVRETPGRMARFVGAPTVHPSHAGATKMETPFAPMIPWPTDMVGETMICDADGNILDRLALADGEGWAVAEVAWEDARPRDPLPENRFWMATLPFSTQAVWHLCNPYGRAKYELMKARREHAWQDDPRFEGDLPDRVPAGQAEPVG